ncbi:O-antigen translocase [Pedobacter rhizosphaerae]|uniref:Polysaccharide transporter, PST family n=1 Tax=Pedobacter rhizosphaerae TaxID=390241 RepID=A0A1H9U3Q0_9SPHI|nr:O-antigen translocase [Pedobacter rhizosphaerae]SES03871.1 polysaccharide transporter, PST family [Pedobacter rhizosphaerae]
MVSKLKRHLTFQSGGIFKVFSLTAVSTLVKMLTGLVSVKVVAVIIGPSGIALLGQLNSFATIIMVVASGGINTGITKYISEYRNSNSDIIKLLSNALKITLACSIVCGLFMIVLSGYLSRKIMLSNDYKYIFVIFGATVFLYALNGLISSVLNGYKEFKLFVVVNIIGSLGGLIFTLSFVYFLGLKGALISAVTFQSVMFLISLIMIRKLPWVKQEYFNQPVDKQTLLKYLHYSLMTFVTAATAPVAQIILRGHVIANISATEAGWWEAMSRISNMYLLVITTSFSVYYLPRLSEINNIQIIRKEIINSFKIIVPVLIAGFSILYIGRFLVIKLLFSTEFLQMEKLFLWQLLGDFFKITSWLLAYLMIAKAMTRAFIITEVFFTIFYLATAYLLMSEKGVLGIVQAYAVNYFVYLIIMLALFRKTLFYKHT